MRTIFHNNMNIEVIQIKRNMREKRIAGVKEFTEISILTGGEIGIEQIRHLMPKSKMQKRYEDYISSVDFAIPYKNPHASRKLDKAIPCSAVPSNISQEPIVDNRCEVSRKVSAIKNRLDLHEKNKKAKKKQSEKLNETFSYNAVLKKLVNEAPSMRVELEELCRMMFGIQFEHGEGYEYAHTLLAAISNEFTFDLQYREASVINKSSVPRRFVEYHKINNDYFEPVLPKKCDKCEHLVIYDKVTGKNKNTRELYTRPLFKCLCDNIYEAPRHDCLADTIGEYVVVKELTTIAELSEKSISNDWIMKKMKCGHAETVALAEDLETICPGDRSGKYALMSTYTSWQLCFLAFELKKLEGSKQPATVESYSEVFTEKEMFQDDFNIDSDYLLYAEEDNSTVEAEEAASYNIGQYGVKQFTYEKPHYADRNIKDRGRFTNAQSCQELIDTASKLDWNFIDWKEYHDKKDKLISTAKSKMHLIIDWIKENKVEAKKLLVQITYRGFRPEGLDLTPDDIHLMWQAVKA